MNRTQKSGFNMSCMQSNRLVDNCFAFKALSLGMTSPDYAWISFGWYFSTFWEDPYANRSSYDAFNHCTPSELEQIVDQMILIDQYSRHDEKDPPIIIGNLVSMHGMVCK